MRVAYIKNKTVLEPGTVLLSVCVCRHAVPPFTVFYSAMTVATSQLADMNTRLHR